MSALPSLEALSTTMSSTAEASCETSDCRQNRKRFTRLKLTTMTVTAGGRLILHKLMYYSDKEHCATLMQSLGIKLRTERERRKISIAKIADDTCIAKRYLEAIEADDLTALPGDFFYRAFVRQYSTYLGWDADETEKQINQVSSSPSFDATLEQSGTGIPSLLSVEDQQVAALRETLKSKPMRPPQDPKMSNWWLGFAVVVIIACAAYFGWRNFSPGRSTEAKETVVVEKAPVTPPQASPVATPTPTPISVEQPKTEAPKTVEVKQPAPIAAPTGDQFSLTVHAKSITWIRITADGVRVFGGTIEAGQEKTINAKDVELIVGNAGTLDVFYKGQLLAIGTKGEVKTLLLNSAGWKLKAKPPSDPAASVPGASPTGGTSPGTLQ